MKIYKKEFKMKILLCLLNFFVLLPLFTNNLVALGAEPTSGFTVSLDEYDFAGGKEANLYSYSTDNLILNTVFPEIRNAYNSYRKWDTNSYKCRIDLYEDLTVNDITHCNDVGCEIDFYLHGHTLRLNYDSSYWYFNSGLYFNGGTVTSDTSNVGSGCLWITGGYLSADNVKFTNFNTQKRYPLLNVNEDRSSASFTNCEFVNMSSTSYGGAIYMNHVDVLEFDHCTFSNCSSYYGGAIYLENVVSQYALDADTLCIDNCKAKYGGGFYIEDNYAGDTFPSFHFWHSEIKNCSAVYYGGGIYSDCYEANINFHDSIIDSCSAQYGAALYTCASGTGYTIDSRNCKSEYGGDIYDEYNSNAGTLLSSGSLTILFGALTGVFLITSIVFAFLYFKDKKGKNNSSL